MLLLCGLPACRLAQEGTARPRDPTWEETVRIPTVELSQDLPLSTEVGGESGWTREKKALLLNGAVGTAVGLYGLGFWNYGGSHFEFANEGWLEKDTSYGGADKLGHAYSTYLTTLGFASLYQWMGYTERESRFNAVLSSLGTFTLIEVGDGFSKNGFSHEDLIVDGVGAALGYLRLRYPAFERTVDFRVEYLPSPAVTRGGRRDFFTDYSGYKYLVALKLGGFQALEDSSLQYVELQAGYYTRGFGPDDADYFDSATRRGYVAVGINLSRVLHNLGHERTARVFNYYQFPYAYGDSGQTSR